jgi:hypothetical protein
MIRPYLIRIFLFVIFFGFLGTFIQLIKDTVLRVPFGPLSPPWGMIFFIGGILIIVFFMLLTPKKWWWT